MAPLLEVENFSVDYIIPNQRVNAVRNVSFALNQGEVLGIVGESGSGKTTVAHAMLGLVPPPGRVVSGSIRFDGKELTSLSAKTWQSMRGRDMAMVFQGSEQALTPTARIGQFFLQTFRCHGLDGSRATFRKRALELLELVRISRSEKVLDSYPFELSGGMCQRVMIALGLALEPKLLIADEPSSGLDVVAQIEIVDLINDLRKEKEISLMVISHDLGFVARLATRIAVMYKGEIVEDRGLNELLCSPRHEYSRKLFSASQGLVYHKLKSDFPDDPSPSYLELNNVSKKYRATGGFFGNFFDSQGAIIEAVIDASLSFKEGEGLGIVGPSGAGKTTLARMISGTLLPTSGDIRLMGQKLDPGDLKKYRNLQMISQYPAEVLDPRLRVGKIIGEPLEHFNVGSSRERNERVETLLAQVGLPVEYKGRYPHQLSGGEQQRVCIARALALRPKLLVCDEPVSSLDLIFQIQILELLAGLQEEYGLTLIMISHDLRVVRSLCERLLVMDNGRIVEQGLTCDIFENPCTSQAHALINAMSQLQLNAREEFH
ncbi:MAG: ABC transporter ATP-binding protein [Deltaproteobacteria bacterium]|nr:ABC transporter ATP-binding protein [Deltaproteobacteria bacterium]